MVVFLSKVKSSWALGTHSTKQKASIKSPPPHLEIRKPSGEEGERVSEPERTEDTRSSPSESTKQDPHELTETEAASTGRTRVCMGPLHIQYSFPLSMYTGLQSVWTRGLCALRLLLRIFPFCWADLPSLDVMDFVLSYSILSCLVVIS